jgi:hypothetical protein
VRTLRRSRLLAFLVALSCAGILAVGVKVFLARHSIEALNASRGPIVIRSGGTYSGRWQSLDDAVPAVTIATTEPVVIQDAEIRSTGDLIYSGKPDANLTVVRTLGVGLHPKQRGHSPGRFVKVFNAAAVTVRNNELIGTAGIWVGQYRESRMRSIQIQRNLARNIDGRRSDGVDGWLEGPKDFDRVQFAHLSKVRAVQDADISWNEVVNEPGASRVEDVINLFLSSGTPARPIQVHDNFVSGAFPLHPESDPYSGGGILLGDGVPDGGLQSAYVTAFGNQVVGTENYGIAIAAGHDITMHGNRAISDGRLPDGRQMSVSNAGLYIWDFYVAKHLGGAPGAFRGNYAYDNVSGWMNLKSGSKAKRTDVWFPDCATAASGASRCVGNLSLSTAVTAVTEADEARAWQEKLVRARIHVGRR